MLFPSYVSVAFFVMKPPIPRRILRLSSGVSASPAVGCDDCVTVAERRDDAKKVLAIYEPRFIFSAVSLWSDGLPTQVTTELPGNESTMEIGRASCRERV